MLPIPFFQRPELNEANDCCPHFGCVFNVFGVEYIRVL